MFEAHLPYIEVFSILSCARYPSINPFPRQWEIYNYSGVIGHINLL
jgi:hypothetical protein